MRIGEVAIISYRGNEKEDFIRSICKNIEIKNDSICFGRFEVNDQLALHLYGISIENEESALSWDLISKKMLGYIFIISFDDTDAFNAMKPIIDNFSVISKMPILIMANTTEENSPPISYKFYMPNGIQLAPNSKLFYGNSKILQDAKQIMLLLVNMLLEKVA